MPPAPEERLNRRRLLEQKKPWPAEPKPRGPSRLALLRLLTALPASAASAW